MTVGMQHHDALLVGKDLSIGFGRRRKRRTVVAEGLDGALYAGELVCLIGPNGAGKSTLLRTLGGLQPPLAGTVLSGEEPVRRLDPAERARRIGVVLTERVEIDNLPVMELVALGRHPYTSWTGRLGAEDRAVVEAAMSAAGVREFADRPIGELSDGERQKAMVARALAQQSRVLLLDEPTAFLDVPRRVEILRLLRRVTRESNRAVLVSTHDLDLALKMADRLWLLPRGGPLIAGLPEALVLNGALASTFLAEGVTFDAKTAAFQVHEERHGCVELVGTGTLRDWTAHALQRVGFFEAGDSAPAELRVVVHESAAGVRWHGHYKDAARECSSLEELLDFVRVGARGAC